MTAEFVPAVDYAGETLWLDPDGEINWCTHDIPMPEGWRRLGYMQPVETPPSDHSDECEDGDDSDHLDPDHGGCQCGCSQCSDEDQYCICPACSRPASHAHRPVTE